MILRRTAATLLLLAPLLAAAPGTARAEDDDGVYGRLDGDLGLRLGAGAALAQGDPSLSLDAAAVYLDTAGLYLHYTDALGSDAAVARSLATGVHFQPLFLARYASDLEHGPPHLDLLLDSVALGIGAFWSAPRGDSLASTPGLEVALSIAFPLLPDATGPYLGLRGALRWRAADLHGTTGADALERGAFLALTLRWHHVLDANLVDPRDGLLRASRPSPRVGWRSPGDAR